MTGVPFRSLVLADVDLDAGTVTARQPLTPLEHEPDGVHALCWFHGTPVGELTQAGPPALVLPRLVDTARSRLRRSLVEHLLEDALAAPGGIDLARRGGLLSLGHPAAPPLDLPSVTVAVCTRDRPEALRDCLRAVAALEQPVLEVLVVDNGSTGDATRQVVESFAAVRYVQEPRRGLDWARNRALLEARGDLVAFTDDDVLVDPGWAAALARTFAAEPTAACVTGLVVPAELSTPAQVLFEVAGGFNRGYRRRWFGAAVEDGELAGAVFPGTGAAGTGASMALRRDVAVALGGFDTALDVGTPTGGGGDLEMFFRVVAAGHELVYEPAAVVRHRHRASDEELHRQLRGNGSGSFSFLLGAGRFYGEQEARALRRFATGWYGTWHARQLARGLLAPELLPPSLRRVERRGAVDAVVHGRYRQAQQLAESEDHRSPGPRLEAVRPATRPSGPRNADPVVTVDLLAAAGGCAEPVSASGGRRTRVRVLRGGRLQDVYTLASHGAPVTAARLRQSLVRRLGPAVLAEGLSWWGPDGQQVGGPPTPAGTPVHARPPVQLLEQLLHAGIRPDVAALDADVSVSVLMATRDRPALLARSLQAIARQDTARSVQVVVVDNSDDPRTTAAVVAEHEGMVACHEPVPGLSRARNTGQRAVTGDLVLFVDDDVLVPVDWIERLVAPFRDPRVAAVTGGVLPANVQELAAQIFEDYGGLGRGPHRRTYWPEWLRGGRRAVPTWHIGATANAAVRRSVLERLGPWDEALGPGTPAGVGEDTEYFYRVLRGGGRIAYEPTAAVQHSHRPDVASLGRQLEAYTSGHVAYHLQVLTSYGDVRGLRSVLLRLPRYLAGRGRDIRARRDDYPPSLLAAEVRGYATGVPFWVRSRRRAARWRRVEVPAPRTPATAPLRQAGR